MLDLELTPRTARRERFKRARAEALAGENEDLFVLLTVVHAASAPALHTIYFARRGKPTTPRSTTRALSALLDQGLLERQLLTGNRSVYRLTSRSYASSPRVHQRATENIRAPIPEHIAGYCWLRSNVWADLVKQGYEVGRGRNEVRAVRRSLVDRQRAVVETASGPERVAAERVLTALRADDTLTPCFRSRCPACGDIGALNVALTRCARCGARPNQVASESRFECSKCGLASDVRDERHGGARVCTGAMREVDHLPFDVAWRSSGSSTDVVLILVDDPERNLRDQLNTLPLRIAGQPRLPIVIRTTDPYSVFDPVAGKWIAQGDRHRLLLRAFSDDGDRRLFPFSSTADVIDVRPNLQLRLRVNRKDTTHG